MKCLDSEGGVMQVQDYMTKAFPTWDIKIVPYLPTHPTGWYNHSAQIIIHTKDGLEGKCRMSKHFILEAAKTIMEEK
jgi:hypothetical protein